MAAQSVGADGPVLNAALALGGLTPSLATLIEVKWAVRLSVMVRPRPGGFCHGETDFTVMRCDIDLAPEHGADGIVFGALTEDGRVDVGRCRLLVRQIGQREAVFHRAFDVTPDPHEALERQIGLGVRRVMTSGQEATVCNGAALIADLIRPAAGRIGVIPAGGANRFTVADVVDRTGCDQVHASLRTSREDRSVAVRPQASFGGAVPSREDRYDATSPEAVAELRALLGRVGWSACHRK